VNDVALIEIDRVPLESSWHAYTLSLFVLCFFTLSLSLYFYSDSRNTKYLKAQSISERAGCLAGKSFVGVSTEELSISGCYFYRGDVCHRAWVLLWVLTFEIRDGLHNVGTFQYQHQPITPVLIPHIPAAYSVVFYVLHHPCFLGIGCQFIFCLLMDMTCC
jgi:hypothetical protein